MLPSEGTLTSGTTTKVLHLCDAEYAFEEANYDWT